MSGDDYRIRSVSIWSVLLKYLGPKHGKTLKSHSMIKNTCCFIVGTQSTNIINRTSPIHQPLTSHLPTSHSLTSHSPATHQPLTSPSPAPHQPLTSTSPAPHQPITSPSPATHQPLTSHSQTTQYVKDWTDKATLHQLGWAQATCTSHNVEKLDGQCSSLHPPEHPLSATN